MLAISLYNLVNTFWVARLGYQAVAAVTVVMPFFIFCIAIGVGTGVGVNALASRRFGEKNAEGANQVAGQTVFLSILLGIIFLLVTNLFPRQILRLAGATADVMDLGEDYLRVFGLGMPLFFFTIMTRNVFQASGDAIRPMIFSLTAQVINAVLDPLFIFGLAFFPRMGVGGAALGTVIANAANAGLAVWYVMSSRSAYRIRFHHTLPHPANILGIYRVGLPSAMIEMTESIIFALFNHVVAGFGSVALAAVGIAGRISDLAFMPVIGTAHGLLPIVGFSLGAKLWSRLWGAVRQALVGLVIFMAIATALLEVFTRPLVTIFTRDPELVAITVPGMRIFLSTLTLVGPAVVFITTFQGLSKAKEAMLLSLARQCLVFVPAVFILPRFLGIYGVWLSLPISDIAAVTISGLWILHEYRLQKKDPAWAVPQAGSSHSLS